MKNFSLKGSEKENFKKIERILPKIIKRLGTKTYGLIPASIMQVFIVSPGVDGLLVSGCLFKGKISKIAFRIEEIIGKKAPSYSCVFYHKDGSNSFTFQTKKKNYTQKINILVSDGDYFKIFQTNPEEVQIKNINLAVLTNLNQKEAEVQEFIKDQISLELDDERI